MESDGEDVSVDLAEVERVEARQIEREEHKARARSVLRLSKTSISSQARTAGEEDAPE